MSAATMTRLDDLFDLAEFATAVEDGYVRVQHHPTLGLHIANYSEKAQYERVWTSVTLACRGLIYDDEHRVIARPYRKFFNHGDDANTGPLDLAAPVVVSDKLDGSLGISYPSGDGWAVATRGSFASDQSLHATAVLRARYGDWEPMPGVTYLWEIVYPANRIVLDYGQQDDLILHGGVDIETGTVYHAHGLRWPGPRADVFPHRTLADALAAEPRANAEGMVIRYLDTDVMVKIKQADYVALHRIITGLNARTVWEWLGNGKTVGDLCATIPDDFHGWVESLAAELYDERDDIMSDADATHDALLAMLPDGFDRGEYARLAIARRKDIAPYLFSLLDNDRDRALSTAWRAVKPSGARSMVNHSEAVA